MRRTLFFPLLMIAVAQCYHLLDDDLENIENFGAFGYDESPGPDFEIRNLAQSDPGMPPKTASEMMTRFNRDFMKFLSFKKIEDWKRLMQVMDPKAYIETCMGTSYGLSMEQFYKWMTYLSKYYVEVALTSTVMTDNADSSVSTELTYRTEVRGGQKGSDKWSMSAALDSSKGHFVINSLIMLSDCRMIPKRPPLEPAVPVERFLDHLRTKLVSDIFLNEAIRYKSAYESMYDYLNPHAYISVCDVGKMNPTQFVEYWNKRYGKVQHYKDHYFNVTKNGDDWHVDFAVTYQGEPGTFFRDRYRFIVQKYMNFYVEYFENFMDWMIFAVQQNCTEDMTKMSKSDASLAKMALASRRWDQLYTPGLRWDTQEAFLEMFDQKTFNGWYCGNNKFPSFESFSQWIDKMKFSYNKSIPKETKVYAYADEKIGFYIINELTANDGSVSSHTVYFEGYYKNEIWYLNHCGFSCSL